MYDTMTSIQVQQRVAVSRMRAVSAVQYMCRLSVISRVASMTTHLIVVYYTGV